MIRFKKITFTSTFIFICIFLKAQEGFVTCGNNLVNAEGGISYSVGQISIQESNELNFNISEGLQQFNVLVEPPLLIHELNSNIFRVWPNPTQSSFVVDGIFSDDARISVAILNELGEKIHAQKVTNQNEVIDISYLPQGLYFLNIKSDDFSAIYKLIKN